MQLAFNGIPRKEGILDEINVVGKIAELATSRITFTSVKSPYTGKDSQKIRTSQPEYSMLVKAAASNPNADEKDREP